MKRWSVGDFRKDLHGYSHIEEEGRERENKQELQEIIVVRCLIAPPPPPPKVQSELRNQFVRLYGKENAGGGMEDRLPE